MNKVGNLLIIAHAFPPSGGAGVRRVLKVIKYLTRSGWQISVLSPHRGQHFAYPYDPDLCHQVPETVCVIETFAPERSLMTKSVAAGANNRNTSPTTSQFGLSTLYNIIYKRLKGLGQVIAIPELAVTWLPFAVWTGLKIIRQHKIDVILATAPPFSTLLTGATLKWLTGVPLVVEFRDAWIAEPARIYKTKWRRQLEKHQETWVIQMASQIVSVTAGVTDDFMQRYAQGVKQTKFVTIPNGYDQADFSISHLRSLKTKDDRFNIVYTGALGGVRTPKYFLEAIQILLTQEPYWRSRLRITFVGLCIRFEDGLELRDYIEAYQLHDVVEMIGFVSREESLLYQRDADLLLLLIGIIPAHKSKTYGLSAKVFDYALAGKPVLALAEEGATADFMRAASIGQVVSHYDQAGIIEAVKRALGGTINYSPNETVIEQYDYTILGQKLDQVLHTCQKAESTTR